MQAQPDSSSILTYKSEDDHLKDDQMQVDELKPDAIKKLEQEAGEAEQD